MKLLDYINSHNNWQTTLSKKPYCLSIKYDSPYYILKYDMIESDFNYQEVWDARGLIIRHDGNKYIPISFGLRKFFNATEKWASPIDWSTARVQSKIDGSNIRFAYDPIEQTWLCSTMGNPDSKNAMITKDFSFFDAVVEVLGGKEKYNKFLTLLDKDYTYIFELVSHYNIICCHYTEQKLYYISRRNMNTEYEEIEHIDFPGFDNEIAYPITYSLSSYEDCVKAAAELEANNEGFVVVDAIRNRVKIKTPWYLAMHKLRGNGAITAQRVIELWQSDSLDDFVAYYPEFTNFVNSVLTNLRQLINDADSAYDTIIRILCEGDSCFSRKLFAQYAKMYIPSIQPFLYARLDRKCENATDFYSHMLTRKLVSYLNVISPIGVLEDE